MSARRVLTYGIFDRLSPSDAAFLRDAARLGGALIVGCATDRYCAEAGVRPALPYDRRRAQLLACRFVDRVIPMDSEAQTRTDIVNCDVDTLAMGADSAGLYDDLADVAAVRYLPRALPTPTAYATPRIVAVAV